MIEQIETDSCKAADYHISVWNESGDDLHVDDATNALLCLQY